METSKRYTDFPQVIRKWLQTRNHIKKACPIRTYGFNSRVHNIIGNKGANFVEYIYVRFVRFAAG